MNCAGPYFEGFESNLRAIIWARELGKTAALVSNLCPNASESMIRLPIGQIEDYRKKTMLIEIPSVAHHLISSPIPTIHLNISKNPQNGSSKGILCCLSMVRRGIWWRCSSGSYEGAVSTNCSCSCPLHGNHLECFGRQNPIGNCWNCRFEAMYRQNLPTDDSGENG